MKLINEIQNVVSFVALTMGFTPTPWSLDLYFAHEPQCGSQTPNPGYADIKLPVSALEQDQNISRRVDAKRLSPLDTVLTNYCDRLGAFIEAHGTRIDFLSTLTFHSIG